MNIKELGEQIGLDEDEYRELLDLFLETGRADYTALRSALDAGDADQVARRAHTISGAAGNMGIMAVHAVAKRIEQAASLGDMAAAADDLTALGHGFDEIAAVLRG